jgi:CubicO group peptidase (beta-lactamase class C family)
MLQLAAVRISSAAFQSRQRPLFLLQSTQKLLTATAILRLAETGRLRLDDPGQAYCPAFGARPAAVAVRRAVDRPQGVPARAGRPSSR